MKELNTILTTAGQGEHTEDDGLIHCDQCGQPRQVRLTFSDRTMTVRCQCQCQQEQAERRRQDLRRQEELDRFARMRSTAMRDPALSQCTFAASRYNQSVMAIAENYVAHWPRMLETGAGLLLWGNVGTGKTYIAACIANALLDKGIPVLMTSFSRMLGTLPGPASGEQTRIIDQWMQYPLLIIDDLGIERDTPYTMEQVFNIIDSRYRSGKPMIITTNLTMQELEHPETREKMRIYDRVLERCTPVRVDGTHIREFKRAENRSYARTCLKPT
jgi:DNA replication protein DnaC